MTTRRNVLTAIGGFVSAFLILSKSSRALARPSSPPDLRTDAYWRDVLSPDVYDVMRNKAAELPGSSPLLSEHRPGIFRCAACKTPLFSSRDRLVSAVGWPCFSAPLKRATSSAQALHFGAQRLEISCEGCGGHLGLAFEEEAGTRFCINGIALIFTATGRNGELAGMSAEIS